MKQVLFRDRRSGEEAAELGGAGAPEAEVFIEVEEESEEARPPLKRMNDPKEPSAGEGEATR